MIIGLGIDIVELYRIRKIFDRFGNTFARKLLHPLELAVMPPVVPGHSCEKACEFLASRLAAKEAGVKALGTGFSDGISLHDLYVLSLPSGRPQLILEGKALMRLHALEATQTHVSLSHGKDNAVAVVIVERPDSPSGSHG